jgi:hypothetical protein
MGSADLCLVGEVEGGTRHRLSPSTDPALFCGDGMLDDLLVIEAQFDLLVKRLTALIDGYADDSNFAAEVDRLSAAREKAAAALELVRQYREHHS